MKSTPSASSSRASWVWPMRHLAITGIETARAHGLDHLDRGHARHAALAADVGGHALERHHRRRARVLGDARLLGVRDVEDHAALQHLRESDLQAIQLFVHGESPLICMKSRPSSTRSKPNCS